MYEVCSQTGYARSVWLATASLDNALAYMQRVCVPDTIEPDADNPGCYDGLGRNGLIYSVEPVDRTTAKQ